MIHGMTVPRDDAGEEVYSIRNIAGSHKLIAHCILKHARGISPKELRSLRTEMGLTQHELGEVVKKDHQTVGRWERGEDRRDGGDDRAPARRGPAQPGTGRSVRRTGEAVRAKCNVPDD
jgi:DNA-binding transcriptional regulator YiaG